MVQTGAPVAGQRQVHRAGRLLLPLTPLSPKQAAGTSTPLLLKTAHQCHCLQTTRRDLNAEADLREALAQHVRVEVLEDGRYRYQAAIQVRGLFVLWKLYYLGG